MIVIEVKKAKKCSDDYSVFLTSKYNPEFIQLVKQKPVRYWHPENKCWETTIKYYKELEKEFKRLNYELNISDPDKKLDEEEILTIDNIPNDYKFKTKPYKHQVEGIDYGLKHNKFLLGDEQGLGKTMQVINIACIKKQLHNYKHCLIICGVNGLKWNWKDEVEKHSNEKACILGTRYKNEYTEKEYEYIGSVEDRLQDLKNILNIYVHPKIKTSLYDAWPYFLITNVETLRNSEIQKTLKELCEHKIINMIAFDEFHKVKNPSSIQGKAILKIKADNMIAMTGTPLMNSPIDLYMPLKWLGYEDHNFYAFKNHYCIMGGFGGYEIVGYKNMEQLKELLQEAQLRRLKNDVLDLPEKIYINDFVEMSPKQSKIYKEVKMEIKENIDMIINSSNPLAELIRLRQATGYTGILSSQIQESAKFERLDELVEEIVANGDKAIIFSNWTSIINPIFDRLKKYNPAIITGAVTNRVAEQNKFMNDDNCKVIVGTTGAMGTGLTLTAGRTVIFLDEPWNRALKEQAEDRAHRIGTSNNVTIITLMCKGTIDEKIHELVETKGKIADILVDGKMADTNKEELVNFLLS